ncbi:MULTISPECIES: hypothetical protein [Actinomycetes]|uniref:hypothetical protein n=1 Tax=Actinomycetes TaxID=1760 RepID=UPI0004C24DD3|nr:MULTISPECIES: hypothetical protein [Actinomycetes]
MTVQRPDEAGTWISDAAAHLEHGDEGVVLERLGPRLRSATRLGVPITTDDPGIEINERAIRQLLARAIDRSCRRDVAAIHITTDHGSVRRIGVEMVARYGDQIGAMSEQVRDAVRRRLGSLRITVADCVDVTWVDVQPVDPASPADQPRAIPG